jgi:CysZ protein
MKSFFHGMSYNLRGFRLGLTTCKLLMLGLLRFALILVITIAAAVLIVSNYQEILSLMWRRPESVFIVWLWHLVSWLLAMLLTGISALIGYLVAQILFSAVIMDKMSQITERLHCGALASPVNMPVLPYFWYLIRQEIPRAVLPLAVSLAILVLGWFTPLGPVLTIISPLAAGIFLAWDNTDLVPARRFEPFRQRWRFLRHNIAFHLGFGLLFMIPVLNIVLLSFAPVGATLYYIDHIDRATSTSSASESGPY